MLKNRFANSNLDAKQKEADNQFALEKDKLNFEQQKELAKRIKDVVLGVLREEKRLGGLLR